MKKDDILVGLGVAGLVGLGVVGVILLLGFLFALSTAVWAVIVYGVVNWLLPVFGVTQFAGLAWSKAFMAGAVLALISWVLNSMRKSGD